MTAKLKSWSMYIDGYTFTMPSSIAQSSPRFILAGATSVVVGDRGQLLQIAYFTALVDKLGATDGELGSEAARQAIWLKAVSSIKRLTVVRGFHSRDGVRDPREPEKKRNEKQTDVNIAVALVRDAALARYDSAILITGDSDQIPAVRSATKDFGRSVDVWLPPGHAIGRWAECQPIRQIQVSSLTRDMLEQCRLPDAVRVGRDMVEARPKWRGAIDP